MPGLQDRIPPCIPESHPYRITSTKCRINTVVSPDDEHIVPRNMERKEINILKKLCTKLALFTRLYRDVGQQNIKNLKKIDLLLIKIIRVVSTNGMELMHTFREESL